MAKASSTQKRRTTKGTNRRRQGYELTRQRDMMPVAMGAALAALVVHIVAYILAPEIFNYTLKPTDQYTDTVKDETKRVYFKVKKEAPEPPDTEIEEEKPKEKELAAALMDKGAVSVILNENRDKTNVILGRKFRTIAGQDTLDDVLCGLNFDLSPAAFFQVNPTQTEVLYRTALDFAQITPDDTLCDVYCGAGTITLMMARHCKTALGIEIVPQAIDNARANARRNGIANTDFRVGAAEDVLPRLVEEGLRPDVIVVDPPRKGLDEKVIHAMAKAGPRRIVYVSCNVATQARDAALLQQSGYRLDKVQPVDMFAWTSGVECVGLFTKAGQ